MRSDRLLHHRFLRRRARDAGVRVSQAFRQERRIRAAKSEFAEAPHGGGALAARSVWQRQHAKAQRRLGLSIVANEVAEHDPGLARYDGRMANCRCGDPDCGGAL